MHPILGFLNVLKFVIVNTLSYKTISVSKKNADKKWFIVDAEGQGVGRLSSRVAKVLRGKHKPSYTPHSDCGDNVIVINAEKIVLSGNKAQEKTYLHYTGFPSGQRSTSVQKLLDKHPERILEKAIKGMLPKNTLGRALYRNLKVYAGENHDQEAQKPKKLNLDTFK